jgi:branched-subunit amino acid ABC-type transport system permease component
MVEAPTPGTSDTVGAASAPPSAVYVAPEFEVVVPYAIMVAVLLFRPQGLFGVAETRAMVSTKRSHGTA